MQFRIDTYLCASSREETSVGSSETSSCSGDDGYLAIVADFRHVDVCKSKDNFVLHSSLEGQETA